MTCCARRANALDIAVVQVPLQGIATTEGAHASPNPLLTQKHVWQSVAGDFFVLINVLEENSLAPPTLGLVVFSWARMGLHVSLEIGHPPVCLLPTTFWADEVHLMA